jgi:hypothetical protein
VIARIIGHVRVAAAGVAILAAPAVALAQGAPPVPPFQSGGIKVTVNSIAAKNGVSMSLSLQNTSKDNLFVAVIGPPIGINGGIAYGPAAIGGVAYCIHNPSNAPVTTLDRSEQITACLKAEKPQLTPDMFTLVEAGNTVPMTVEFTTSVNAVDQDKDFSFSMNVAVFREADLNAPDDNAGAKTKPLPKSLRYLSIGVPPLPLKK